MSGRTILAAAIALVGHRLMQATAFGTFRIHKERIEREDTLVLAAITALRDRADPLLGAVSGPGKHSANQGTTLFPRTTTALRRRTEGQERIGLGQGGDTGRGGVVPVIQRRLLRRRLWSGAHNFGLLGDNRGVPGDKVDNGQGNQQDQAVPASLPAGQPIYPLSFHRFPLFLILRPSPQLEFGRPQPVRPAKPANTERIR
jgi:hypothetical protein